MPAHATAQLIGGRSHQCDATATYTRDGVRAYALLDGIGSTDEIRDWTRTSARRVARAAAVRGDAEAGLRTVYNQYAAEPDRQGPWAFGPKAAAVVAVTAPDKPLSVAWCGDSRAYLMLNGIVRRLTDDHNLRRVYPDNGVHGSGNRNIITSCLGNDETDDQVKARYGHPAIESTVLGRVGCRLLLASDGAYEPLEDAGFQLSDYLIGDPRETARCFVETAVATAGAVTDPHADNATVLIADLT